MGTAYCLQHMHELNPPMALSKLTSTAIYLTDDYAAKVLAFLLNKKTVSMVLDCLCNKPLNDLFYFFQVGEVPFGSQTGLRLRKPTSGDLDKSVLPLPAEPETNVYNFGVLMLEMISGKPTDSDEEGSITKWVLKLKNKITFFPFEIDMTSVTLP